jgi:MFS family permease
MARARFFAPGILEPRQLPKKNDPVFSAGSRSSYSRTAHPLGPDGSKKEHFRMGLSYRWVIVGAGALMTCVGIGAMFSLAVYLEPMSTETGWSRAGISSAMTIDFLTMGIAGFAWGAASDRIGTRPVVLCGALLLGTGLILASRATSLLEFQLTYGILIGIAAGAFFAPMIAAATRWFDNNRSLAVSLVSAGMGVAPMTISPLARWLISTYDWRTACSRASISDLASWERCSAPRRWCRAWAWRSDPGPAA